MIFSFMDDPRHSSEPEPDVVLRAFCFSIYEEFNRAWLADRRREFEAGCTFVRTLYGLPPPHAPDSLRTPSLRR